MFFSSFVSKSDIDFCTWNRFLYDCPVRLSLYTAFWCGSSCRNIFLESWHLILWEIVGECDVSGLWDMLLNDHGENQTCVLLYSRQTLWFLTHPCVAGVSLTKMTLSLSAVSVQTQFVFCDIRPFTDQVWQDERHYLHLLCQSLCSLLFVPWWCCHTGIMLDEEQIIQAILKINSRYKITSFSEGCTAIRLMAASPC